MEVSNYDFNFYISSGINESMLDFSNSNNLNFIPGIFTPAEIIKGIEYKYKILKFFHAEKNGCVNSLEFYQDILFIPTGGVNLDNFNLYLKEINVLVVGSTGF